MAIVRVPKHKLEKFVSDVLLAMNVDASEAAIIARVFVWFDLVGRMTQGVWRLPVYLKRYRAGLIASPSQAEFERKSETTYILHGRNGFGQYLGHVAMEKAVALARKYGAGVVGVNGSNHFGAGAYYVQLAAENRCFGFAFSNSVPHVAPYGGLSAVIGTNPFAFAAPTQSGKSVLVDFSTGATAGSMIMKALEENRPIPENIVIDEEGNSITDPRKAAKGVVLPFGGAKGYCLGLMIEILAGVVTGAGFSHGVASLHKNFERPANVGHFIMAVDIEKWMPLDQYFTRMEDLIRYIKNARPQKGVEEILLPGERRWKLYEDHLENGIPLDLKAQDALTKLADELKIATPW